jgi:hypothetical protein
MRLMGREQRNQYAPVPIFFMRQFNFEKARIGHLQNELTDVARPQIKDSQGSGDPLDLGDLV